MGNDGTAADDRIAPERAGDCVLPLTEAACVELVACHGPMVKAVCCRILRDETLAEDATQEVFLLLVQKLPALSPQTVLGGWLYVAACHLARTNLRTHARRRAREHQAMAQLMNPAHDTLWEELEPLLDDAMLTLPPRQRDLVLARYFKDNTQRAAAALVGCSESVASRELAAAVDTLRKFFHRHGVAVSGATLITLLGTHGAQASIGTAAVAASLSSASAAAGTTCAAAPLLLTLMKTATTTKIAVGAAALLVAVGTVTQLSHWNSSPGTPGAGTTTGPGSKQAEADDTAGAAAANASRKSSALARPSAAAVTAARRPADADTAIRDARNREKRFWERIDQVALLGDAQKAREILLSEYGIDLSVEEIRQLQERGPKGFRFGVIELWATRQPREALAWAATVLSGPNLGGTDLHQMFLDAARKSLPGLNREALAGMLPEGEPATARMLDILEATTDPGSLANRILTVTDSEERASRLRLLAQGWGDSEAATEWARQHLSGADKTAFYSQVAYNLAHQNPATALAILAELQGTDAYASTLTSMMRGVVQEGGRGQQVADLIAQANLTPEDRASLISELARRWVRQDPDATVAWVNSLTAPEDFRAAIPLLVSQLDNSG